MGNDASRSADALYDGVLADLRAKLTVIEQAHEHIIRTIASLEGLRGSLSLDVTPGGSAPVAMPSSASGEEPRKKAPARRAGSAPLPDLAADVLRQHGLPMPTAAIVEAVLAAGAKMNSKDNINTMGGLLRRRQEQVGDIVRIRRGVWGLSEWRRANGGETPP